MSKIKKETKFTTDVLSKADMIKDLFIDIDYLNRIILKAEVKLRHNFTTYELVRILNVYPEKTNRAFDTIYERIVEVVQEHDDENILEYKTRKVIPDVEIGGLFAERFIY